jgi:hypothetical protein
MRHGSLMASRVLLPAALLAFTILAFSGPGGARK